MTQSTIDAFAFMQPGDSFPAYGSVSEELGPIAIGGDLEPSTLLAAYSRGIFPWYSNPPILWWSPNPRMVLPVAEFQLHRSLRKTLQRFRLDMNCEIRVDFSFSTVLKYCANVSRGGQNGTWIVPEMQAAYTRFHESGYAHSVETWVDNQLVGGLYFINVGQAVFGESMFALQTDASKIALAALVSMCKARDVRWIDCQQNTNHLASLGAHEVQRDVFLQELAKATSREFLQWNFQPADWLQILKTI